MTSFTQSINSIDLAPTTLIKIIWLLQFPPFINCSVASVPVLLELKKERSFCSLKAWARSHSGNSYKPIFNLHFVVWSWKELMLPSYKSTESTIITMSTFNLVFAYLSTQATGLLMAFYTPKCLVLLLFFYHRWCELGTWRYVMTYPLLDCQQLLTQLYLSLGLIPTTQTDNISFQVRNTYPPLFPLSSV